MDFGGIRFVHQLVLCNQRADGLDSIDWRIDVQSMEGHVFAVIHRIILSSCSTVSFFRPTLFAFA